MRHSPFYLHNLIEFNVLEWHSMVVHQHHDFDQMKYLLQDEDGNDFQFDAILCRRWKSF